MALVPPLALLLWEIGKFVARRTGTTRAQMRVDLVPATTWSTAEPSPPRQLDADTAARLLSTRTPPRDRATHPCAGWPPNSSPRSAT
jgi:hypothetical protein